ncbi:hypothetical protein LCGC14_1401630 [marine sediment metagenome]|uniref:Uncharacterized protein n=1 Tax=marine sediment metagenome TaxID=412755 RepID=A0A0F9JWY7_9ZZZZ
MILSFDLDGVIANTDNGLLNLLHQNARTNGNIGSKHYLQQYYARRSIDLDPRSLVGPQDIYHIVTGRIPSAHEITKIWVERWLGYQARVNLHLVGDKIVEDIFERGDPEQASRELALRKMRVLKFIKADVHFDNNPTIVSFLREHEITAVLVGGGLL